MLTKKSEKIRKRSIKICDRKSDRETIRELSEKQVESFQTSQTWGNSSYKPPGASYVAQGPHKQSEILKHPFYISSTQNENLDFWTWILVSGPLEPAPGRKYHVESEFEVRFVYF